MKLNNLEKEILQKLADGKSAKEIAEETGFTSNVIYGKLTTMRDKNGLDTTLQMIVQAFREKQIA